METIQDNGVTFVKATALAKKYRYTTDYIGQLCRAGKIEAKLIGRAWFVNEESLKEHKSDRYNVTRSSEITIQKSSISDRESHPVTLRREVRPVLSKATHRAIVQANPAVTYNFETRGVERISTYLADEEILEPVVDRVSSRIDNQPQEDTSHKIKVLLGEAATRKLSFDPLPEVTLQGDLVIDSLDDPDLFAEVEPVSVENIQFKPRSVADSSVVVTKRYQTGGEIVVPVTVAPEIPTVEEEIDITPVIIHKSSPVRSSRFIPESAPELRPVKFVVVPVFVAVSLVVFVLTLGLTSYAETDGLQFNQSTKFSMAAVSEAFEKFSQSY